VKALAQVASVLSAAGGITDARKPWAPIAVTVSDRWAHVFPALFARMVAADEAAEFSNTPRIAAISRFWDFLA
jgi:hypothetical protein